MAIILYRRGTGDPVKVNEFGFEHSLESGNYYLTPEDARQADRPTSPETVNVEIDPVEETVPQKTKGGRPRKVK